MLEAATIKFLSDLQKNNHKDWFEANRKRYEAAKENFAALVTEVIGLYGKKDADIASLKSKDCTFRINRDVRFSKNKMPYKSNMAAGFNRGGKKSIYAGYYFHCQPGGQSFIAGGVWMPEADVLKKIRQEIDYNWTDFKKIITNKKFTEQFGHLENNAEVTLVREPKGYEKDNPAIEYLKLKSFVATMPLTDEALTDKALVKTIVSSFETLKPLISFINEGLHDEP